MRLNDGREHAGWGLAVTASLAVALLGAACSGSPTSSTGVVTLDSPRANGSQGASGASPSSENKDEQLLAYSRCMRGHGVANFPDPVSNGGGGVGLPLYGEQGPVVDLRSATSQAAQQACQSLLPALYNDNGNSAGGDEAFQTRLAYSQCMRDNGVSDFPDPQRDANGGITMDRTGLEPNSPAFQ